MSNSSILSVQEMIDAAFGEADANVVNFKLIQTVLYILARQLRLLERRVRVEIDIDLTPSKSQLSVTEIKMHATVPKRRRKIIKQTGGMRGETKSDKPLHKPMPDDKSASEKSSEKTSSKSTEQSSEKTTSKSTDQSSEKTTSKSTEQSSDKTTSKSTEQSSDKTTSKSTDQSSEKTTSKSTEQSTLDKSSTTKSSSVSRDKTSSDRTKSSTDKSSSGKTTTSSKKSPLSISEKPSIAESKAKDYYNYLESVEEQREKELRIIHQRANSLEEGEKSPTPMVSLESVEEQYEKLLVVERVPTEESRVLTGKGTPQLGIVTQDQFEGLAKAVQELQRRFAPIATPDFPDNMQLMQDLRKGASLTDAMAALQLSARLEAAEKTLKQMMGLVTDLAGRSGVVLSESLETTGADRDVTRIPTGTTTPLPSRVSKKSIVSKPSKQATKTTSAQPLFTESSHMTTVSPVSSKIETIPTPKSAPAPEEEKLVVKMDYITFDDLEQAIQEVADGLMKTMTSLNTKSNANAENAIKLAAKLEDKLDTSLNVGTRMSDLELLVSEYSEQINALDTGLSSQMTNYQEQLTQMQHDLEAGLEAMAEALANTGGDTAAVTELNAHFTNLQTDVDSTNARQKELKENQKALSQDLQALWKQIELLRETKSDRDEVADALRDKAGLGALNGLVSLQQFNAVRGDFEKRIGAAYDKFNNQEITWQKAIDDLLRELNEKADWLQMLSLRDDINKNLEMLRGRLRAMLDIVGEPRSAAVARKLFQDSACLSCASPAHMDIEEPAMVPKLPAFPQPASTRPPAIGAEVSSKPGEDGDHGVCYPGRPIPHPIDPRAHTCQRYCGGSHTLITDKHSRTPVGIIIRPALRRVSTGIGSDGKIYMMEESEHINKPCVPCNEKKINTPQPSETDQAPMQEDYDSDMTPIDFVNPMCLTVDPQDNISVTPPAPIEEF